MTILSPSFPLSLGHYRLVHRRPLTHSMGFIFFSVFFSFSSSISSFLSIALCSWPFSTAWSRRNNVLHKDKVFLHITLAHGYSAASAKRALLKWTLLLFYLALNPLHCTADSEHTITNTIEITVVRCVLARWCILLLAIRTTKTAVRAPPLQWSKDWTNATTTISISSSSVCDSTW